LRGTPSPLQPATPSELSLAITSASKPGTEFFANSMNATREAMEATGHAFVTIGASMDVRKWGWPGYLTFSKGALSKAASSSQGPPAADVKNSEEEKPVEGAADTDDVVGGDRVALSLEVEAGLRGDVDRESLHEAMSTDGREWRHEEEDAPLGEENTAAVHSTSQISETMAPDPDPDADATPQAESDALQDAQASSPSSPASPSTPVIHPSDLTSSPSLSSSQSTLPAPVPAPSFRSFSLHFSPREDPLDTARKHVMYMTTEQLTLAFLEPTPALSEGDNAALYQTSSALLANVQGLIDHDEASNLETPITAAKILQPKDKHLIAMDNHNTTVTSAEFASYSEHLFNGSQMIANGDAIEVFSRTQGPQHWHIARREPEGTVYLEVLQKETSLADVENELVGIVRRFRDR